MAVTKSLIAPIKCHKWAAVYTDARPVFLVNSSKKWQMLLGPDSAFSSSEQVLKLGVEFDQDDFNSIRFTAYLFQPSSGTVSNAASCEFKVYKVSTPQWTETLVHTFSGVQIFNSYFFADINNTLMPSVDFFGGDTIMVEATVTRLSETYRDRLYINHLGIFDNVTRLKNRVTFVELTKKDE